MNPVPPLLALAFAFGAHAQTFTLRFDLNGNLVSQTAAAAVAPPQILAQPQNQIVVPGGTASFSVVAADLRQMTYQWQFRRAILGGGNRDSILREDISVNDEGEYRVVLTNPSGSVTSAPAFLMLDSDGDGLGDSWEAGYFTSLSATATADIDGDGVSNRQEFLDGTDPTNSSSARYRLLVLRDGGSIRRSLDQVSYTNGESVTLTAIATPGGEHFHAWTGDVVTRDNPVTLAMTNNKTVYARFTPIEFNWTNASGGDWDSAANWSPNLAPGSNDIVVVTRNLSVNLDTVAHCLDVTWGGQSASPLLSGAGTLHVSGHFLWAGGGMSGTGRTVIEPGATLSMPGSSGLSLNARTLEVAGTARLNGVGPALLLLFSGATVSNRAGALFEIGNRALIDTSGPNRFDNAGTVRKLGDTTTATIGNFFTPFVFNNLGTLDIRRGVLEINGAFTSGADALLNCAVGGLVSGTNYGQLRLNGQAELNGAVRVEFTDGFMPAINDAFAVVTGGTRQGSFAHFLYPSNLVTMQLSNTPNSVIARIGGIVVPELVLLPPVMTSSNLTLCWVAESNKTYRLEFNPDLSPTSWFAVPGEVITLGNKACISDALTTSNRFYRVRVLP